MKAVQSQQPEPEPVKTELTWAEENAYERLRGYFRHQSLLSLTFTIAKRRYNLLKKDPNAKDGYARKMGELISEILHSPLYQAGCKQFPIVEYVGNLYETYFEECNFSNPGIKEFMEADWNIHQNGENPQAWMEQLDPDFADPAARRQLASFWNRAENLLSHQVKLPQFFPCARSAPAFGNRNVGQSPRSLPPTRSVPQESLPRNRSPLLRKPQHNLAARPQDRTTQPERRTSYFAAPAEKKPEVRPPFGQSPRPESQPLFPIDNSRVPPPYSGGLVPIPNVSAEAYRSFEFPNVARSNEQTTFAPAVPLPAKTVNWKHEVHRFDYAHRRVIITKEDNRHASGLLTIKTEYLDLGEYVNSGRGVCEHTSENSVAPDLVSKSTGVSTTPPSIFGTPGRDPQVSGGLGRDLGITGGPASSARSRHKYRSRDPAGTADIGAVPGTGRSWSGSTVRFRVGLYPVRVRCKFSEVRSAYKHF